MILLFGEKANKTHSSQKNSNVKNHPVENSGILAMNLYNRSLLNVNEYDSCEFSQPYIVDYAKYADEGGYSSSCLGFMSEFSDALSAIGDASFGGGDFFGGGCDFSGGGCSFSSGSSSFSSVC